MTNQEFIDLLTEEANTYKRKAAEAATDLQKEFWRKQINIALEAIEDFKRKIEGTH